jgi:hypothetical protein
MAYRNLPLKPQEYHLLGFKWNDIPILSHIVKNSSKYLLHISNEQIKKIIQNMKHHTIWHKYLSHIVKACTKSFKNLTGR